MAESAGEGLENLVDHVEFEDSDDKHEAPRQSAREKHSTEKGVRICTKSSSSGRYYGKKVLAKTNQFHSFDSGDSKGHCVTNSRMRRAGEEDDAIVPVARGTGGRD